MSRTSVIVLIVSRRMTEVSSAVCFWYMGPQGQRYATLCSQSQAVPVAGNSFTMHFEKEQNITQLKYNFCPIYSLLMEVHVPFNVNKQS